MNLREIINGKWEKEQTRGKKRVKVTEKETEWEKQQQRWREKAQNRNRRHNWPRSGLNKEENKQTKKMRGFYVYAGSCGSFIF